MPSHIQIYANNLNFPYNSGVNRVTTALIQSLMSYSEIKKITLIGYKTANLAKPKVFYREFTFLDKLKSLIGGYLPWIWSSRASLNPEPKTVLIPLFKFLPKEHTEDIHIYYLHDLYSIQQTSFLSWKQRLLENRLVYKNIEKQADMILVNSIATALDLQRLFGTSKEKIKLIYPV